LALHHGGGDPSRDVERGRRHQAVDQGALAVQDDLFWSFLPLPREAGAAMPACSGALMPGHAFSIEDALVASRWAKQILSRGYRVVITPRYKDAEEIIEVYIPSAKTPVFRVHRTPPLGLDHGLHRLDTVVLDARGRSAGHGAFVEAWQARDA